MPPEFANNVDRGNLDRARPNDGLQRLQDDILQPEQIKLKNQPEKKDALDKNADPLIQLQKLKGLLKDEAGGEIINQKGQQDLDWFYRNQPSNSNYHVPAHSPTDKSAQQLVDQLGDPEYQKREEAQNILDSMDDKVLPLLHATTSSARDPEVQKRASVLASKIERRALLNSGESIIKAYEDLNPSKGQSLPKNWSEAADKLIQQADNFGHKGELQQYYQPDKAIAGNGSLEEADLGLIAQIARNPRLIVAESLSNYASRNAKSDQQIEEVRSKAISILSEVLKRNEVGVDSQRLIAIANETRAINDPHFLTIYRNELVKSEPQWQAKSDEEIRKEFSRRYGGTIEKVR